MSDRVYEAFLNKQLEEGMRLAESSDLFELLPYAGSPAFKYIAVFHCKGLVKPENGEVETARRFAVGIWMPSDYLRKTDPAQILTLIEPADVWHPNIRAPFICIGNIAPGTPLKELVYRVFDVITYQKVTMNEYDSLNKEACQWSRANTHLFPVDNRPLKRRQLKLDVEPAAQEVK